MCTYKHVFVLVYQHNKNYDITKAVIKSSNHGLKVTFNAVMKIVNVNRPDRKLVF